MKRTCRVIFEKTTPNQQAGEVCGKEFKSSDPAQMMCSYHKNCNKKFRLDKGRPPFQLAPLDYTGGPAARPFPVQQPQPPSPSLILNVKVPKKEEKEPESESISETSQSDDESLFAEREEEESEEESEEVLEGDVEQQVESIIASMNAPEEASKPEPKSKKVKAKKMSKAEEKEDKNKTEANRLFLRACFAQGIAVIEGIAVKNKIPLKGLAAETANSEFVMVPYDEMMKELGPEIMDELAPWQKFSICMAFATSRVYANNTGCLGLFETVTTDEPGKFPPAFTE